MTVSQSCSVLQPFVYICNIYVIISAVFQVLELSVEDSVVTLVNVHCVSKNVPTWASCNFNNHG